MGMEGLAAMSPASGGIPWSGQPAAAVRLPLPDLWIVFKKSQTH